MERTPTKVSIDVLPERDGTWSVCAMDSEGEVLEAKLNLTLLAAVGTATEMGRAVRGHVPGSRWPRRSGGELTGSVLPSGTITDMAATDQTRAMPERMYNRVQ